MLDKDDKWAGKPYQVKFFEIKKSICRSRQWLYMPGGDEH